MVPAHRYAAHDILVDPARQRPEIWRILAGIALIVTLVIAFNLLLNAALFQFVPDAWGPETSMGSTPFTLMVLLGSFIFISLAVAVTARQLHARSLSSVLGPISWAIRDFFRVLAGLVVLGVALWILPPWGFGIELSPNLPPATWLVLLPLSIFVLLIQTSAEEILFRGYLQQQLAARFAHPVIWMGVPSALFAFGHYLPAEAGPNAWVIAVWSGLFGLLMADLTARAGSLGPAIAVHFANNFSALLIVSLPDSLNGLALYTVPFTASDPDAIRTWMPVDFATMIVSWLVARLAIRR
ncbi:CPBP family intramembrane glutamic endopeptidase [Thalassococcus sp. S3]|uniref:CPBP family intramembrane glutamic endopeptidase n=1 Tax=Thalassococcus sp. S3 TaxID=2017482 RepID=UPI0010246203|nr:type II CAAX endopeptidase family protein [Thalassococcus sp. S3]QBF29857.1 CPBP family intramembrane metalloprotease domain-containing protein [Thalassococcus sp. S3]